MTFKNREHAAEYLVERLRHLRGTHPLVLGIPRGGVPMARVLADALDGDLDVVLVRKLRAPDNPQLVVGAVDEAGDVVVSDLARVMGVARDRLDREIREQVAALRERRRRLAGHPTCDPRDRTVVVVDDGIATGATMLAALRVLRKRRPHRVVVATAVGSRDALGEVRLECDEVVCIESREAPGPIARSFGDFTPVSDAEVVDTLRRFREKRQRCDVVIPAGDEESRADLAIPSRAKAVVVFAQASCGGRKCPRTRMVAETLQRRGMATLLADLLTEDEDDDGSRNTCRFDIDLLTRRLGAALAWLAERPETGRLPVGLFGTNAGAACALDTAAQLPGRVGAVVCGGGRPDLALDALPHVGAPTLLLVGGLDQPQIGLNQLAYERIATHVKRLEVVPGASRLFDEPGTLERAAGAAARWFEAHLVHHGQAAAAGVG